MMSYCVLTLVCLLSLATAQTVTQVTGCLTKENNLQMDCSFTPVAGTTSSINCTFTTDGKVVASSNNKIQPDSTYKNRGTVTIVGKVCQLNLNGIADDKPKIYNCTITQTASVTQSLTVDKKALPTCSAWSVLQQSSVALLLALLTLPLFSELL